MLLHFLKSDPTARPWFVREGAPDPGPLKTTPPTPPRPPSPINHYLAASACGRVLPAAKALPKPHPQNIPSVFVYPASSLAVPTRGYQRCPPLSAQPLDPTSPSWPTLSANPSPTWPTATPSPPPTAPTIPLSSLMPTSPKASTKAESFWIAEENGQPHGCVGLVPGHLGVNSLVRLAVLPPCRGRGLGTLLVQQVLSEARRLNLPKIELGIIAAQSDLQRLYERLGFRVLETAPFRASPFRRHADAGRTKLNILLFFASFAPSR